MANAKRDEAFAGRYQDFIEQQNQPTEGTGIDQEAEPGLTGMLPENVDQENFQNLVDAATTEEEVLRIADAFDRGGRLTPERLSMAAAAAERLGQAAPEVTGAEGSTQTNNAEVSIPQEQQEPPTVAQPATPVTWDQSPLNEIDLKEIPAGAEIVPTADGAVATLKDGTTVTLVSHDTINPNQAGVREAVGKHNMRGPQAVPRLR